MLAISPLNLRETLYELIDREIENAPRAARRRSGPSSTRSPKRA